MSFLDDVKNLKQSPWIYEKNFTLMDRIIASLKPEEQEALKAACANLTIASSAIAELLENNGHPISIDTVRRYRRKLRKGTSVDNK
jgi:hypothetical protein